MADSNVTDNEALYEDGPAAGSKAPILIAHFEGAMDAGSAGTLAVVQLLRSLAPQRVATFDTDLLLDYRSHRPIMEVDEWVTTDVSEPEIALDLLHDDTGTPILILHGPEPDARWKSFRSAVDKLVTDAGVEVMFSFHGLPAAVPHTRPSAVHLQSTDRDLIPQQPMMGGQARFPAPLTSFLQYHLHEAGVTGVTLLSTVPYYLSDAAFPRASSALLRRLADIADLQLPVGDLERGADEDDSQVERLLQLNPDLRQTVQNLERHFDSISNAAAEGVGINAAGEDLPDVLAEALSNWDTHNHGEEGDFPEAEQVDDTSADSMADALGAVIESYLRTRTKQKPTSEHFSSTSERKAEDSADKPSKRRRPAPRHRAAPPWEAQEPPAPDEDDGDDNSEE